MKSFRVTKTKEQIAEQKVKEENSLVELQEFFSMLASANKTTDVYVDETAIEAIEELVESNDFQDMLSTEDCVIAAFEELEPEKTLVDIAAESIKKTTQVKESVFELPTGARVEADVKHLQSRVRDLQNWLSKIAMTGPGSGEVNFRWLDDVNRESINDGWVLEYDSESKKFQFTENIGDIRTIKFNTDGPTTELVPGQIAWNPHEDCLDVRHADGATLQTGLEQHYRVYNNGATTLTQGTLVGFGGIHMVDGDELPVAIPYVANATALPLYVMGILTSDVPPLGVGRATVFGKVRNIDTTGDSGLGETWNAGDLLWAHPSMQGRLTKVQPSAPYPAISVAAILRASSTNGVLLVRPTIFPRLWFGRFRDFTNQTAAAINTPYAVRFGQTAISSGFHIDSTHTSRVVAEFNGLYKFDPRLQFTSSNSSIAKIWVWYRVNGVDAPGTSTQYTIQSNGGIVVVTLPYIVSLMAGQYFELMWAADSTNVSLLSPAATSFAPATPCAVVAITQTSL